MTKKITCFVQNEGTDIGFQVLQKGRFEIRELLEVNREIRDFTFQQLKDKLNEKEKKIIDELKTKFNDFEQDFILNLDFQERKIYESLFQIPSDISKAKKRELEQELEAELDIDEFNDSIEGKSMIEEIEGIFEEKDESKEKAEVIDIDSFREK